MILVEFLVWLLGFLWEEIVVPVIFEALLQGIFNGLLAVGRAIWPFVRGIGRMVRK